MLSGPRLLSDGMEQLAWAGGWHVTRFLYSRDTNLHLPMVLAMLVSAGELCLFSHQLCLFSRQLCLFSRKARQRQRLWFGDLASIIASSMLTIVLIDNERGGRGEGREDPMASCRRSLKIVVVGDKKVGKTCLLLSLLRFLGMEIMSQLC